MSNTRTIRSNPAFVQPTSDPEHLFQEREFSFQIVYNDEGPGHVSDDELEPIYTLNQASHSLRCEGHPLFSSSRAQSAPAAVNPENGANPHICEYNRRTIAQGVSRENSRRSFQATEEAVESALLDLIITGTSKIEAELMNTPYEFIKTGLTDMDKKGAQEEVVDLSIDRCTQSTSFVDAFTSRAPVSSRFTRSVAQFTKTRMDETADEWRLTAKAEGCSSAQVGNS